MLGTKASLRLMTNLINKKEVCGIEANMWLTTLSFIKDPTKEMLNEVKPLISSEDNEKAMLGVSSLVYAYCKKNECENDVDIASIVVSIEDKIGVGCYVTKTIWASNVVWSSKSFLPRSAMTNITFDLFGRSVNLLEIGGRMEGLEYFLESYFGPNGYFQENDVKEVTKQNIKGISNTKMEDIDRQFDTESDSLKGDLYMRVFEMSYCLQDSQD
ncbi:unnamed protein product [Mytilus edulis]|uniref:Uncharacterized protein n=1 Tax=Mytilus edulis TaxID=6550 RepID=A0A8S3RWJ7_MYTED|nr:unnamed protein product [Mytilus edulis]